MIEQVTPTNNEINGQGTNIQADITPEEVTAVSPTPNRKAPIVPILVAILLIGLMGMGLWYYMSQSQQETFIVQSSPSPIATLSPSPVAAEIGSFSDPRIQNMNFTYDPTVWTITTSPLDQGLNLVLTNKDGSTLTMNYDLPAGRGGSVHLLKQNELVTLANGLSRFRYATGGTASSDTYQYGKSRVITNSGNSYSTIVLFSQEPTAKDTLLAQCAPDYQGMTVVSSDQCPVLQNTDQYVGYIQGPVYQELIAQLLVDKGEMDPVWAEFTEEPEDKGVVLISVQYQGANPTAADEIISQLKF